MSGHDSYAYWGIEHWCGGVRREMVRDMGWVADLGGRIRSRRWIECIRCGQAAEVGCIDRPFGTDALVERELGG